MNKHAQTGSALVLALFVLIIVGTIGIALLFNSQNEVKSSQATGNAQKAFYVSEGGLEDGRATIYNINRVSPDPRELTEELMDLSGGDNVLDLDPDALAPVYDGNGDLTGFTGYGNDVPLRDMTQLGDGWYAAFVQNDPDEGVTTVVDDNNLLLLTAIAVREDRTTEKVRALVERIDTFAIPPSTITILGPDAVFDGGSSAAKDYWGNDFGPHCPPGVAGEVPIVGVIGGDSETSALLGIVGRETDYNSDSATGADTVDDLTSDPNLPELWTNCSMLVELAEIIQGAAEVVGDSTLPEGDLGTDLAPKSVFIDGDYTISGNFEGGGLLFVTGNLTMEGSASWYGPIFVVGKGDFLRDGAGSGTISGGVVVADVAGPDRSLFTADDCFGEDGVGSTPDDGIAQSSYIVNGAGNSTTGYCSAYFTGWQGLRPFKILSFLQD